MTRWLAVIAALAATVAVTACAARPAPPAAQRSRFTLVAVDDRGAVVFDMDRQAFTGVRRTGGRAWTHTVAGLGGRTVAHCAGHCPTAVFAADDLPAVLVTGAGVTPMAGAGEVFAARSATDYVARQAGRLVLTRPRTAIAVTPDAQWAPDAAGNTALLIDRGTARPFARTAAGWQAGVPFPVPAGDGGACLTGAGRPALLFGEHPTVRTSAGALTAVRTDLPDAADSACGAAGFALVEHSMNAAGTRHTAIRAFTFDGSPVWSREIGGEALVTADPARPRFAIALAGQVELVDGRGRTTARLPVASDAAFTVDGALVTVDARNGVPRWGAPPAP